MDLDGGAAMEVGTSMSEMILKVEATEIQGMKTIESNIDASKNGGIYISRTACLNGIHVSTFVPRPPMSRGLADGPATHC